MGAVPGVGEDRAGAHVDGLHARPPKLEGEGCQRVIGAVIDRSQGLSKCAMATPAVVTGPSVTTRSAGVSRTAG